MKTLEEKIEELKNRVKTKTIKVAKKHIKQGKPGSPTECAVALAFQDAFTGKVHCTKVSYSPSSDRLEARFKGLNGDVIVECETPKKANVFADRFDDKKTCQPMTFRVKEVTDVRDL